MKAKQFLCLALLSASHLCNALSSPINGTYVGLTFGASYTTPIENVLVPLQAEYAGNDNIVAITDIYPSIGGNLGLSIGRRFKDRYRIELEFDTSYSVLNDLKYTTSGAQTGTEIRGYVSTYGSLIVNAFIDLIPSTGDYKRASPYFGFGAGSAYLSVKGESYNGDAFVANILKVKKTTAVVQAIFGMSYFLDDYTSMGLDYRVQRYAKIEELGADFTQHNLNFTVNFTLED